MSIGDIGVVAAIVVIVAGAQLLLLTTMLKGTDERASSMEARLIAHMDALEARLGGRIDVLVARFDGIDRRTTVLEDHQPRVP